MGHKYHTCFCFTSMFYIFRYVFIQLLIELLVSLSLTKNPVHWFYSHQISFFVGQLWSYIHISFFIYVIYYYICFRQYIIYTYMFIILYLDPYIHLWSIYLSIMYIYIYIASNNLGLQRCNLRHAPLRKTTQATLAAPSCASPRLTLVVTKKEEFRTPVGWWLYRMGPPSYKLVYKPWNNPH